MGSSRESVDEERNTVQNDDALLLLANRYRVAKLRSDGAITSVWTGEDVELDRQVAIEILSPKLSADKDVATAFAHAARLTAGLWNHMNVVTVYDVGEHEGRPFLVMELLSGRTLADVLAEGAPHHERAVAWVCQAAAALDAAHAWDLVHGALKPSTLLLDESDRVAVAGFGLATAARASSLVSIQQALRTAAYMAPEQARGGPPTPATDRYALAAIAHELLSGEPPFGASGDFEETVARQVEEEPPAPSARKRDLPVGLADFAITTGLKKDPSQRWLSSRRFAEVLALAFDEPTAAATATTIELDAPSVGDDPAPPAWAVVAKAPARAADHDRQVGHGTRARRPLITAVIALVAVGFAAWTLAREVGGYDEPAPKGEMRSSGSQEAVTRRDEPEQAASPVPPPARDPSPNEARRLTARGYELLSARRYDDAIRTFRRAARQAPGGSVVYSSALFGFGRSLRLAGRVDEALPVLRRRAELRPRTANSQRELAAAEASARAGG